MMTSSSILCWVRRAVGALCFSALVSCGGGGGGESPPDGPPTTGSVSGQVVSAATGAPMAGVTVSSGSATATTGSDGKFTLAAVTPGAAVLSFSATDHARSFANATVVAGASAAAGARLTPIGTRQTYAAAAGATIAVGGTPAQVALPPSGIVTPSGAAFDGTVTVELTPINPAQDPANMPGGLSTRAGDGTVQPIESFGALSVSLQDGSGNRLNLGSGATATIRIPLATRSPNPPATVPLYYFSETTGLWAEEGTATLKGTAPDQYYEGTVSHFTVWNADQVTTTVRVLGCVQEVNGTKVANVVVRSDGVDYSGSATTFTDASGNFSVAMRRGSRATVAGEIDSRTSNAVETGPSDSDITLPTCLVLGNGSPVFVIQPQSASVSEGGYAVLQAVARGQAPMRYQWQRNGVDVAGATTSVLVIDPVGNADNGATYRVVASNAVGSAPSDNAMLTVASLPPAIGGQPQPASVVAGADATFTVQMLAQGAPLSYQWRRNGVDIAGATASSYTLSGAQMADSGAVFSVRIRNDVGQVVSVGAALTVTAAPTAPSISQQPASVSVNVGQTAQFVVVAGGTEPLSYQWRRNGADIQGARSASYTLNAVALSDNGAVLSVVVTNSVSSVTSAQATLTVTQPPAGSGYFHVGQSGAWVTAPIVYANGSQTAWAPALVAINSIDASGGAATVEVAGAAVVLPGGSVIESTISGGQASNTRERYSFYFKNSRLHRLDQLSPSGTPAGQIVSTLTPGDVCGEGGFAYGLGSLYTLNDVSTPSRSWLLMRGPGADGQCQTADDVNRAVRGSMSSTDAALTLAGTPLVEIVGSSGSLDGVIVADGQTLRRLDGNLANATALRTLSGTLSDRGFVFGSALPGIWLFVDGNTLYAYKLDGSGGAPTAVLTLTAAEAVSQSWYAVARNGAAYVAIEDGTASRLLRVGADLAVFALGSGPASVNELLATPTRLLVRSTTDLTSRPLAGGAAATLATGTTSDSIGQVQVSGERVYIERFGYDASFNTTRRVVTMASDGSGVQTLDNTALMNTMLSASVPVSIVNEFDVYAVVVAQGLTGTGQYSGATLKALLGSTGATLVTYGTLPSVPGQLFATPSTLSAMHFGQTGLITTMTFANDQEYLGLLFYDTDVAGLTVVTQPLATPQRYHQRATAQSVPPAASLVQRVGLTRPKATRHNSTLSR
jgi:hypothetical protein